MGFVAPVALFVYNRPEHTRRTLKFLAANFLAEETRLFVFSDAAKTEKDQAAVDDVRSSVRAVSGFRSVELIERTENMGLAQSIIAGVTRLVNEYGQVVVFEDDLISSPHTLTYFNAALARYKANEQVMHIGAYMYPIRREGLPETFFYRIATSWGWATWKRAWDHFEPDIEVLMSQFDDRRIHDFSIGGTMNFWKQMQAFKAGKNNSWAIRWYASIFLRNGLALHPAHSLIDNIGHDGSGIHSGTNTLYRVSVNPKPISQFPVAIRELPEAHAAIKSFLKDRKGNLLQRIVRFVRNLRN